MTLSERTSNEGLRSMKGELMMVVERVEMEVFEWRHLLHVEDGDRDGELVALRESGVEALCDREPIRTLLISHGMRVQSPPEYLDEECSLDIAAKLARAKTKEMLRRSWLVEGHVRSGAATRTPEKLACRRT
ncbi:hypothetical protein Tco_0123180 [Tanacetum coccineum]